jgi:hypothetical protein
MALKEAATYQYLEYKAREKRFLSLDKQKTLKNKTLTTSSSSPEVNAAESFPLRATLSSSIYKPHSAQQAVSQSAQQAVF